MAVRKSVTDLSFSEKAKFITGMKELKRRPPLTMPGLTLSATNRYDSFVEIHDLAMNTATPPNVTPRVRNAAHRGPSFLPWHREFILRFEQELQAVLNDTNFGLPYWDWAADAALSDPEDPRQAVVWRNDFMGGNGDPADNEHVKSGPFAHDPADPNSWRIFGRFDDSNKPLLFLKRHFARQNKNAKTLPTQSNVNAALAIEKYDTAPWNRESLESFRNTFEGWIDRPALHNRVHGWVGGSMTPGTSPNDPVFFLHHSNCDRIWALWQLCHSSVPYAPLDDVSGAPDGHKFSDRMFPWTSPGDRRIQDLLDITALGYTYADFHRRLVRLRRKIGDRFESDQTVEVSANCDTRNGTSSTIFLPAEPGASLHAKLERILTGARPGDITVIDTATDEITVST